MLGGLKNMFSSLKLSNIFVILLVAAIFIAVAIFGYNYYIKPRIDNTFVENKEFTDLEDQNKGVADFYFFYTDWCPHCKSAKPVIQEFKDMVEANNNSINGANINIIEVDCDKDTDTANKFNVESYPTIKLVYNDTIYEYDAKPEINNLKEFMTSSIA